MEGDPAHWRVVQGSILDDGFVRSLGQHDVVYSWGVLHHTGSMWKAIDNTLSLVKPGGCAYLAIYNKADGFAIYPDGRFGPSWLWLLEKKFYVSLPHFLQNCIDYCVMAALIALYVVTLHNPIRIICSHQLYFGKGMSWRINIKDWLGGYPYEYATVSEVFKYAKERGFSLENLTCNNGLLNNEFLFRRT
jgi:2-polyprenyl-6-hydroxyphenyl methylase/3-demethylubiquinone-9 3-methyltransferase